MLVGLGQEDPYLDLYMHQPDMHKRNKGPSQVVQFEYPVKDDLRQTTIYPLGSSLAELVFERALYDCYIRRLNAVGSLITRGGATGNTDDAQVLLERIGLQCHPLSGASHWVFSCPDVVVSMHDEGECVSATVASPSEQTMRSVAGVLVHGFGLGLASTR